MASSSGSSGRHCAKAHPKAQVSVATTANVRGSAMALAASTAGADRIFLMGYDYHWSGSAPGASSPIDRRDGDEKDLVWSLDLYEALGVPVERTILGLPLYGMAWPVSGPELGAPPDRQGPATGSRATTSTSWRTRPTCRCSTTSSRSSSTPSRASGSERGSRTRAPRRSTWTAIYVDSPATLTPKMALADARGLAGVGFWAIGYDRGLPDYAALIKRFRAGKLD